MPGAGRMHPRRRVAGPLEGGERLHDDARRVARGRRTAANSAPCPAVPEAVITGFGELDRLRRCTPRRRPIGSVSHARDTPATSGRRAVVADVLGHALHGGQGRLDGGDRADSVGDGRLADLLAVAACAATLALRRVDHERDLAVGDQVDRVDPVAVGDLADDCVDADSEAGR